MECPDPISPSSGYIEVSNFKGRYQYGSVATYRCNPGFILWGNASRFYNFHTNSLQSWELFADTARLEAPGTAALPPATLSAVGTPQQWSTAWWSWWTGLQGGKQWLLTSACHHSLIITTVSLLYINILITIWLLLTHTMIDINSWQLYGVSDEHSLSTTT